MKVAGVYPQKMDIDPKLQHMYGQPTGLMQLLGAAEKDEHETKLFYPLNFLGDGIFVNQDDDSFIDQIVAYQPEVVALSIMTAQFPYGEFVARKIKEKLPNCKIVAGGRHPSFSIEDLKEPFDIYVIGEGENTFRQLLSKLESKMSYAELPGLAYRSKNGSIVQTKKAPRISNLDQESILKKDKNLLELIYEGISVPSLNKKPKYALIEYSRGCVGQCEFCDNAGFWGSTTYRDPNTVALQMKELNENHGIEVFYIFDLNFTFDEKKSFAFCDALIRNKVMVHWYCMSNIVTAKKDLLLAMKEAGCYKVCYGVESTSNASLARMNKTNESKNSLLQIEKAQEVLKMSENCDLINNMYYIIGFPWETEEMIVEGQELLNQYHGHQINVGIFTPHFGTVLRAKMAKEGFHFGKDLDLYNRGSLVYNHLYISVKRMKELQTKIYSGFYNSTYYAQRLESFLNENPRYINSFSEYFDRKKLATKINWSGIK